MFTYVAWAGEVPGQSSHALQRVTSSLTLGNYSHNWAAANHDRLGVSTWRPSDDTPVMPRWHETRSRAVVLPHAPIGAVNLTGTSTPSVLMLRLVRALDRNPSRMVRDIAAPFCLIALDRRRRRLSLANDAFGMTRLYELRSGTGLVCWSNRPAALLAFTRQSARMNEEAWQLFAACGWFMGSSSPLAGVTRVPPSTLISVRADAKPRVSSTAGLAAWTQVRPQTVDFETAADGMRQYFSELSALTSGPYRVMLSGGRDSRAVAAAAIAADLPATYLTLGPIVGEIDTARRLMSLIDRPFKHDVSTPKPSTQTRSLYDRIRGLHQIFDGDFTPIKMNSPPKATGSPTITLVGAGGEIAHANYYGSIERLARLEAKGPRAGVEHLDRYFRSLPGSHAAGYDLIRATLEEWYVQAGTLGIEGPAYLDFFYLVERFRRWAPAAHTLGSYPSFGSPAFIRAAFDLAPAERVGNRLHSRIIAELVPAWSNVPYYKAAASERDYKSESRLRIWQDAAAGEVDELLADETAWGDVFDTETVRNLWETAKGEGLPNRFEAIFQRVLWRRIFEDHMCDFNNRLAG